VALNTLKCNYLTPLGLTGFRYNAYLFVMTGCVFVVHCRRRIASTHGDHTIRITSVQTGKCTHVLEGHPRTPWCIAFHPSSSDILASGCLAGEVRVWDLKVLQLFYYFCYRGVIFYWIVTDFTHQQFWFSFPVLALNRFVFLCCGYM